MKFYTKIFLPILAKEIKYTPLENRHYFELLKFATNNDDVGLDECFNWILNQSILDKEVISELSNLEKLLVLIDLRSVAMGDNLQLNGINNTKIDYHISLIKNTLINKIKNINLTKIVEFNNFKVHLSLPKKFLIETIDEIYKEIINKIEINGEVVNFSSLTEAEKDIIISNIPAKVGSNILNFINSNEELNNIDIISENTKLGIQKFPLKFFDKTIFYFLKSIFGNDLMNFYELQFVLFTKMNITYEHFLKMSPNECKLFINFYNEDMKRQQEAQEKESSGNKMPSLPKMR